MLRSETQSRSDLLSEILRERLSVVERELERERVVKVVFALPGDVVQKLNELSAKFKVPASRIIETAVTSYATVNMRQEDVIEKFYRELATAIAQNRVSTSYGVVDRERVLTALAKGHTVVVKKLNMLECELVELQRAHVISHYRRTGIDTIIEIKSLNLEKLKALLPQ